MSVVQRGRTILWAGAGRRAWKERRHASRCYPFIQLVQLAVAEGDLRVVPGGFVGLGRQTKEEKDAKADTRLADLKRRFPKLWL